MNIKTIALLLVIFMAGSGVTWAEAEAGIVIGGVRYDQVGLINEVSSTSISVKGENYLLGASDARRGKTTVPLNQLSPGMYVGITIGKSPRGQPMVTSITEIPR